MQTITKQYTPQHIAPVPTEVTITFPSYREYGTMIYRFNNDKSVDSVSYEYCKGAVDRLALVNNDYSDIIIRIYV